MFDLNSLNPPQQEAVLHDKGPLLILAGAGSGKTRVITHRIAYLVEERGVSPYSILAITFTNKAAKEMRERAERLLGSATSGMWVMTFHSMCVRILRRYAVHLGYTQDFTIYDTDDVKSQMRKIMKDLNVERKALFVFDVEEDWENVWMSMRNLQNATFATTEGLTCLDMANAYHMVVTEAAVKKIEEALQ